MSAPSQRIGRWAVVVVMVAGALLLFLGQATVRAAEARLAALVLDGAQISAPRSLGTNVLFRMGGAFVGLDITASCSAALLVSPFFLLAAGVLISRRTTVGDGVRTLGMLALWLFAMNQLRILLVVLSMRAWGFERGYEMSHIAFGSVISTLGVLGGVVLFVRAIGRAHPPAELRT